MALVSRMIDENGQPKYVYKSTLERLASHLLKGKCLPFLGAGASADPNKPDLPTAARLSELLARKCDLRWHEYIPLSTIAFYFEFFFARDDLNDFLANQIGKSIIEPSESIEKLVEIITVVEERRGPLLVVTTNYDQHFEKTYEAATGRLPEVIVYKGGHNPNDRMAKLHAKADEWWDVGDRSALYKMHGCISDPSGQNLVVTEEDYVNFLTNALSEDEKKRVLHRVRGKIARGTILFVGYSLADWNFRVIFKATAEREEARTTKSYAVQYNPKAESEMTDLERTRRDALVEFWGKKNVDIINVDGAQFMGDLLVAVRKQIQPVAATA